MIPSIISTIRCCFWYWVSSSPWQKAILVFLKTDLRAMNETKPLRVLLNCFWYCIQINFLAQINIKLKIDKIEYQNGYTSIIDICCSFSNVGTINGRRYSITEK